MPSPAGASFEQLARRAKASYVLGLSATVTRKDGQQPIIFMQCGPVRHRVSAREQAAGSSTFHAQRLGASDGVSAARCERRPRPACSSSTISIEALIADERRNRLIVDDVAEAVREGRSPLVLTERTDHLEILASDCRRLRTPPRRSARRHGPEAIERGARATGGIPESEERVVLATGGYLGEGYDDARLDTLFLTLPVSWRGTIAQYAGRLHRLHDSKREVRIHDYADLNVPMLARMFDRRCKGYEAVGYSILLPASARAGLAARGAAAGRTGMEARLCRQRPAPGSRRRRRAARQLFVHVAGVQARGGGARCRSGAQRQRSLPLPAAETLPDTAGKFRLNAELPIPFDGRGAMEVDLLAAEARLAVEIDGGQHLADPEAYRRDRRKDALLQENGYFVLRFLAEDVGKHLDDVLDTLLRALAHRQRDPGPGQG
jgi:hypothetical protein